MLLFASKILHTAASKNLRTELKGPVDVILEVELQLSDLDTRTKTYKQSMRHVDAKMSGGDLIALLDDTVANAELRMTVPQLNGPWRFYTYTIADVQEGDSFALPQNMVGKLWDPFLRDGNGILAYLGLERPIVALWDNFEVLSRRLCSALPSRRG